MKSQKGKVRFACLLAVGLILAAFGLIAAGEAPKTDSGSPGKIYLPVTPMVTVEIKAPVEKVFAYLDEAENVPKWLTGLTMDCKGKEIGLVCEWAYEREDLKAQGMTAVTDVVPNKRLVWDDNNNGSWTFLFTPARGGTRVTILAHEFVMVPADENAWPEIIKKEQVRFQGYLDNIKAQLEKSGGKNK